MVIFACVVIYYTQSWKLRVESLVFNRSLESLIRLRIKEEQESLINKNLRLWFFITHDISCSYKRILKFTLYQICNVKRFCRTFAVVNTRCVSNSEIGLRLGIEKVHVSSALASRQFCTIKHNGSRECWNGWWHRELKTKTNKKLKT